MRKNTLHKITILIFIGLYIGISPDIFSQTGTIYIVRHAEKQATKDDPSLTDEGKKRAEKLKYHLSAIPISALFSTNYNRTKETLLPTANSHKLEISIYPPRDYEVFSTYLNNHAGASIVVSGHSNTVPEMINHLCGTAYPQLKETEYDNLYIIQLKDGNCQPVINLKY